MDPRPLRARRGHPVVAVALAVCALLAAVGCASGGATGGDSASDPPGSGGETTSTSARATTTLAPTTTTTTAPTTTTPPPPPPKSAVPAVFPPSPAPPRAVDPATPLRVHAFGDSTAFTIGWGVQRAGATSGLTTTTVDARTSTGLTRSDFFDWSLQVMAIAATRPEVAVISFGANDSQTLVRPDGSQVPFGAEGWSEEYARRVEGVLTLLEAAGVRTYWVGQPIARDPGYTDRMRVLNDVYREVVDHHPNATFVDAWHWLSDDAGAYTDALPGPDGAPVALRADDGIHLSSAGGDYLGGTVLNRILADYGVQR